MSLPSAGQALGNAPAIIANISVLVIFASIVGAGILRGLKEYREFTKSSVTAPPVPDARVAAATLLENVTLSEWTTSNREVKVALERLCDMLSKSREETMELRHEIVELRQGMRRGARRDDDR